MKRRARSLVCYLAAAFAGGLLLALLAGCAGGDGDEASVPTGSPPAPTPTAETSGVTNLERFHYAAVLTLKGAEADGGPNEVIVSTEGDFQAPDRHAFTYSTQLGGVTLRESAVVIGDKVWLRTGDAPWREATPEDPQATELLAVAFSPIRPDFLGGPGFRNVRESVRRLPATPEFVNALRSYHYQVGPEGQEFFRSFLAHQQLLEQVRDLRWEVWLAEDGRWPVRLIASGVVTADLQILQDLDLKAPSTWELRIDISRPNDPELAVLAPEQSSP